MEVERDVGIEGAKAIQSRGTLRWRERQAILVDNRRLGCVTQRRKRSSVLVFAARVKRQRAHNRSGGSSGHRVDALAKRPNAMM